MENYGAEAINVLGQSTSNSESAAIPLGYTPLSVFRYRQEWLQLLNDLSQYGDLRIRERAFKSELKDSKFRSIHWAILLRILSSDPEEWFAQRDRQRERYARLNKAFRHDPHEANVPDDDPLSQSEKSVWNQYFVDLALRALINQDVVRTLPNINFFRKPNVQEAMCNILFYYAREHSCMGYRQGMHEILAPILLVVYSDQQSLTQFIEFTPESADTTLLNALNAKFLEADVYSLFERVMTAINGYYRVSYPEGPRTSKGFELVAETEIVRELETIRTQILVKVDLELHNYLVQSNIPLHVCGIRWLRLLFGDEFPMPDLLLLWDAFFADGDSFMLPKFFFVAMVVRLRHDLFMTDYTGCLKCLMNANDRKIEMRLVLQHALCMLMPAVYQNLPEDFEYLMTRPTHSMENEAMKSLPGSVSQIEEQISELQALNAAGIAAQTDQAINDGHLNDSAELLNLEIKNAEIVIELARAKLKNYLEMIRAHITKHKTKSSELIHAMNGIEGLCTLLSIRYMFPLHSTRIPIDEAFEAQEGRSTSSMETESPARRQNSPWYTTGYERPDNNDCFNAVKLLKNLREIELIPLSTGSSGNTAKKKKSN